jgi:hypothetical protein
MDKLQVELQLLLLPQNLTTRTVEEQQSEWTEKYNAWRAKFELFDFEMRHLKKEWLFSVRPDKAQYPVQALTSINCPTPLWATAIGIGMGMIPFEQGCDVFRSYYPSQKDVLQINRYGVSLLRVTVEFLNHRCAHGYPVMDFCPVIFPRINSILTTDFKETCSARFRCTFCRLMWLGSVSNAFEFWNKCSNDVKFDLLLRPHIGFATFLYHSTQNLWENMRRLAHRINAGIHECDAKRTRVLNEIRHAHFDVSCGSQKQTYSLLGIMMRRRSIWLNIFYRSVGGGMRDNDAFQTALLKDYYEMDHKRDDHLKSPLIQTLEDGNYSISATLAKSVSAQELNRYDPGSSWTALNIACKLGRYECLRTLLPRIKEIDLTNFSDGKSAVELLLTNVNTKEQQQAYDSFVSHYFGEFSAFIKEDNLQVIVGIPAVAKETKSILEPILPAVIIDLCLSYGPWLRVGLDNEKVGDKRKLNEVTNERRLKMKTNSGTPLSL